jgi:hypothetical protein
MTEKKDNGFVLSSGIAGFIAASFAKIVTHPLDTVKSKLQIQKMEFQTIRQMVRDTYKSEGVKGFYKGLNITILGTIPASALYFGSYEFAKKYLTSRSKSNEKDFFIHFSSGMFAELIACIVFVPVDIIRERRQIQSSVSSYKYASDTDALKQIVSKEGIRGIYKAYFATVASFGPTSALYFSFFEKFKSYFMSNDKATYLKSIKDNKVLTLTFNQSLICSLLASSLSSFLTSPLDLVKFRMQVQRADKNYIKSTAEYKNLLQGLFHIVKKEGFKALFRGVQARVISMTPQGTIVMTLVEQLKPIISRLLKEENH